MKPRLTFLLAFSLHAVYASAAPSLAVAKFEDKMVSSACNIHKIRGGDLTTEMQRQLTAIFAGYPDLHVVNPALPSTGPGPQYMIAGTLRAFDQCRAPTPDDKKITVAIELKVIDNRTGRLAFTYTSSANATGAGSALGQTAHMVLNDLAFRVERAILYRKPEIHLVRKQLRQMDVQEYQVKLVRRDPTH